jgi:hypothetical protein
MSSSDFSIARRGNQDSYTHSKLDSVKLADLVPILRAQMSVTTSPEEMEDVSTDVIERLQAVEDELSDLSVSTALADAQASHQPAARPTRDPRITELAERVRGHFTAYMKSVHSLLEFPPHLLM